MHDRHAEWKHRTEGPALKAREAAEKARRELPKSEARLEVFRRQLAEADACETASGRRARRKAAADG